MNKKLDNINLLIAGDKSPSIFIDAISSLEKYDSIEKNTVKIWNLKEEYFQKYSDLIDEDGNYFNIIAVNYKTKSEIINFFYNFNKNFNESGLITATYPFFLIDKKVYLKKDLYNEIIKINQIRPVIYHYISKILLNMKRKHLKKKF